MNEPKKKQKQNKRITLNESLPQPAKKQTNSPTKGPRKRKRIEEKRGSIPLGRQRKDEIVFCFVLFCGSSYSKERRSQVAEQVLLANGVGPSAKVDLAVVLLEGAFQLDGVFQVARLAHDAHLDAEDVALEPGALVEDVLDGHAQVGQQARQFGDAARPVAHRHAELDQTPVDGQTAFQAPAQHRRVDVAAAQRDHHPFPCERETVPTPSSERRCNSVLKSVLQSRRFVNAI